MLTRTAFQEKEQKFSPWLLALIFTFCFVPKLIVKIPVLNAIFIVGAVFSFAYMSASLIIHKEKPTLATIMLVAYQASFGLQTILGSGDILMWGYHSMILLTLAMAIQHFMQRDAARVLETLVYVFSVYLTIHFILGLFFKDGVVSDLGFIGIRTRLTDVLFPCLTLSLIIDHMRHRIWSHRTIYIVLLSLALVLYNNIVAAILGLCAMAFVWLLMVLIRWKHLCKIINMWSIFVGGLIANILIVLVQITLRMSWFFEKMLGRSATLSFRTDIWRNSIDVIRDRLFFGYGLVDNGNFAPLPNVDGTIIHWQSHNQWLQTLHDGGIVSLLILLAFLGVCYFALSKRGDRYVVICHMAAISALTVMMIVEIFTYTPYFFVLPLTAANIALCHDTDANSRKPWSLPWFKKKKSDAAFVEQHTEADAEVKE